VARTGSRLLEVNADSRLVVRIQSAAVITISRSVAWPLWSSEISPLAAIRSAAVALSAAVTCAVRSSRSAAG
jgi:hypothetical protein